MRGFYFYILWTLAIKRESFLAAVFFLIAPCLAALSNACWAMAANFLASASEVALRVVFIAVRKASLRVRFHSVCFLVCRMAFLALALFGIV